MSLAHINPEQEDAKPSVNPFENTKKKGSQTQDPNTNAVSAHGNTTDGNSAGKGVDNTRNNPQNNKPMSVDTGKVGKGADTKH
jgi:hypothetical protein